MFSSIKCSDDCDDDIIVKEKTKDKSSTHFPLDCLGEILRFNSTPSIVYVIKCLDSYTKYYVEESDPKCCENVVFRIKKRIEKEKKYVIKMVVHSINGFEKGNFDLLPNLKDFRIEKYDNMNGDFNFEKCNNLECLDIIFDTGFKCNLDFKGLGNLKHLKIEFLDSESTNLDFLHLKNVERFELLNVRDHITNDLFVSCKRLKSLKVTNCNNSIVNTCLNSLKNIEKLELIGCYFDDLKGINQLKKLEKLSIKDCELIPTLKGLNSSIVDVEFEPPSYIIGEASNIFSRSDLFKNGKHGIKVDNYRCGPMIDMGAYQRACRRVFDALPKTQQKEYFKQAANYRS